VNMLKDNTAAGCLHSALDSSVRGHSGNVVGSSMATWARCGHAASASVG